MIAAKVKGQVWEGIRWLCLLGGVVGISNLWAAPAGQSINLAKPVSESVQVQGLYWNFDQGKVGTSDPEVVMDESGSGLDGLLLAGKAETLPVYAPGKFGAGLAFRPPGPTAPPQQGERISWLPDGKASPELAALNLAEKSFTGGIWVQPTAIPATETAMFILMHRGLARRDGDRPLSWSFYLMMDKLGQWTLAFNGSKSALPLDLFEVGKWVHLGFSVAPAGNGGLDLKFWVNGVLLGDQVMGTPGISPASQAMDQIFTVGERNVANYSGGLECVVDDVFVTEGAYEFEPLAR